jgi:DNA (cytosine-5)-methyltransferase 1
MSQRLSPETTPERSRLMARVRQTGTSAEIAVQTLLRSIGYRFSVKAKDLPGSPDIVNRSAKWAIFVHGCFWHAHDCHLWKLPQANRQFWKEKFLANRQRDKAKRAEVRRQGYSVLTLWQCQLKNEARTKSKLRTFFAKNDIVNGRSTSVSDCGPQPAVVSESYQFDERHQYVSRSILRRDGTTFVTRRDMLTGISVKQDARSMFDQVFLRSTEPAWHGPLRGTVRTADLFSGCGGLSLGACEASAAVGKRFESALAIDDEAASLEVYKRNFNPKLAINHDILSVLSGEIGARIRPEEKALIKRVGAIDILLAGPPCQGHSDLNNHTRRKDKRNKLYERVARFAEIAEPTHIIVENVPTVIHGKDKALDNTIARLELLGYKVDTKTVNLAELGVPQRRKRHVLVASNRTISIEEIVERHKVPNERTVRWAIADLAREGPSELFRMPSVLHKDNVQRINYLMRTGKYDLPNRLRPVCHQNEHSYVSMYGRLRYDEPAQTLTSGFGSPGQGRYIHPTRSRTLVPHEAARLQFFPDSFDFSSVKLRTSLANMIANAVPMMLSFVCLLQLLG